MSEQRAALTHENAAGYVGQVVLLSRTVDGATVHGDVRLLAATPRHNHLGGRWVDLRVLTDDGEEDLDGRYVTLQGPPYVEHRWCVRCHARVEVTETFSDSDFDHRGEVGYAVVRLDCGHETARETGVVNPDPTMGAAKPYAGPHRAVAASTHPADLRDADRRQRAINDPWGPA